MKVMAQFAPGSCEEIVSSNPLHGETRRDELRRIAEHYRQARRRVGGALLLQPRSSEGLLAGSAVLILVVAAALELPFLPWFEWALLRDVLSGTSARWPLGFFVLSMGVQSWWLSVSANRRRYCCVDWRLRWVLALPLLGWTLQALAEVDASRRTQERPVFKTGARDRVAELNWRLPSERTDLAMTALALSIVSCLWLALWVSSSISLVKEWWLVPVGLAFVALHGVAAMALGEWTQLVLRSRALEATPRWRRSFLGLWAFLPSVLALPIFAGCAWFETRSGRQQLQAYQWCVGSASLRSIFEASSRRSDLISPRKVHGQARYEVELASFGRLQLMRLHLEGFVLGCMSASWLHDVVSLETWGPAVLAMALPSTVFIWSVCRALEVAVQRRPRLQWPLAILRLIHIVLVLGVGFLWGSLYWAPARPVVIQLLLLSAGISASVLGLAVAMGGAWMLRRDGQEVLAWWLVAFLFSLTCTMIPIFDGSSWLGLSVAEGLVVVVALVVSGGFAIAWPSLPWLLKPARWQSLSMVRKSFGQRLAILWTIGAVVLPLSGLLHPYWRTKMKRRRLGSFSVR